MVSRANLSGRPGMGGVLGKVFKPQRQRPPKVSVPPETGGAGLAGMVRRSQGRADGGGVSGLVGRAFAAAKEKQAGQANPGGAGVLGRLTKPQRPMEAPAPPGQKRGPRRQPTAREQARNTRQAIAGMRGQAQAQRTGLENVGATQEEVAATQAGFDRARAGGGGVLSAEEEATANQAAVEATGEAGGTRTEVDVTEPSLNQARRQRSRSGRIYRR
jgi:hypothetical protein